MYTSKSILQVTYRGFLAHFTIGMVGVAINTFPVYMCARQTILCETMNEEENKYNIYISHSLGNVLLTIEI